MLQSIKENIWLVLGSFVLGAAGGYALKKYAFNGESKKASDTISGAKTGTSG